MNQHRAYPAAPIRPLAKSRMLPSQEDIRQTHQFLFESVPQPLIVYDEDTLRILAVNEAAISTYGYSKNEFLSLTITDIENTIADLQLLQATVLSDTVQNEHHDVRSAHCNISASRA